jgi:hypothetical protein
MRPAAVAALPGKTSFASICLAKRRQSSPRCFTTDSLSCVTPRPARPCTSARPHTRTPTRAPLCRPRTRNKARAAPQVTQTASLWRQERYNPVRGRPLRATCRLEASVWASWDPAARFAAGPAPVHVRLPLALTRPALRCAHRDSATNGPGMETRIARFAAHKPLMHLMQYRLIAHDTTAAGEQLYQSANLKAISVNVKATSLYAIPRVHMTHLPLALTRRSQSSVQPTTRPSSTATPPRSSTWHGTRRAKHAPSQPPAA